MIQLNGTANATFHGIPRHAMVPIVIDAFLDERETAQGGKGLLRIWIDNQLVLEQAGPTLSWGSGAHYWTISTYLWNEPQPYPYNRSTYYKTARMFVHPAP